MKLRTRTAAQQPEPSSPKAKKPKKTKPVAKSAVSPAKSPAKKSPSKVSGSKITSPPKVTTPKKESDKSINFLIESAQTCSTYIGKAKAVSKLLEANYDSCNVVTKKGVRNQFDISVGGVVVWDGLNKGPPRTEKWVSNDVLLAAINQELEKQKK
jgi:hypothetical protein